MTNLFVTLDVKFEDKLTMRMRRHIRRYLSHDHDNDEMLNSRSSSRDRLSFDSTKHALELREQFIP
eukprot:UN01316